MTSSRRRAVGKKPESAPLPGFVDLQVNGARGVDFSGPDLTMEGIARVGRALLERGVVAYCPTVVTCAASVQERNLPLLARAIEEVEEGARILGIHLEGPFINPDDGPRGVHPRRHVKPPSIEVFERLRTLADDRVALLTLAPEVEGALPLIRHVAHHTDTAVSMGHHAADADTIRRAVDAGARAATHVGNGMADMIHRHLNPLWPILDDERLTGLFITDGYHLPPELIRVCLRAKGAERFVVTSDMSHLSGMKPGEYRFQGASVVLEESGHLHRKDAYQLAGSARDMFDCVNHLASLGELSGQQLRRVSYDNPLRVVARRLPAAAPKGAPELRYADGRVCLNDGRSHGG